MINCEYSNDYLKSIGIDKEKTKKLIDAFKLLNPTVLAYMFADDYIQLLVLQKQIFKAKEVWNRRFKNV